MYSGESESVLTAFIYRRR